MSARQVKPIYIRRPCVGAFLNRLPGEDVDEGLCKKIDPKANNPGTMFQDSTTATSLLPSAPSSRWPSRATSAPSARST